MAEVDPPGRMSWEYLAGFTDGEGCIYVQHRPLVTVQLLWAQRADRDLVLREIAKWLDQHGIRSALTTRGAAKTTHLHSELRVARTEDSWVILDHLIPFLIVKEDQARAALAELQDREKPLLRRKVA